MAYIGSSPIGGTIVSEYFSGNGTTTTFNLTYTAGNEASLLVFISGVKQAATSYSVTANQLVFTEPPPSGTTNIEVVYLSAGTILQSVSAFNTSNWTIAQSGQNVIFSYNGTNVFRISSDGSITVTGSVTANGTIS